MKLAITKNTGLKFWLPIPVILLLGLIVEVAIDVQVHDSYFILTSGHLISILCGFFFFSGLAYFIFAKMDANHRLVSNHLWYTFTGFILLLMLTLAIETIDQINDNLFIRFDTFRLKELLGFFLALIFLSIGVINYLLNMFNSFIK